MTKLITGKDLLTNLSPVQADILLSKAKVKVLLQSRQSGKSSTLRVLIYKHALENPDSEILVVAVTHKQVVKNLWRPLVERDPLFEKDLIVETNKTQRYIQLFNGTRISFSGTEAVDNLLGDTVNLLVMDEFQSMDPEVFYKLQPMVSATYGDIIIAGTVRGFNHMWDFYQKGVIDSPTFSNGWRSWKVTVNESPTPSGYPENIKLAKDSMSPQQFAQEYMCDPSSLQGSVYSEYDMNLNQSTKELDTNKALLIGMDFNVNPMCAVIAQIHESSDGLKQLHIIDEIVQPNSNTQRMANTIQARYGEKWKGRIIVYPDASGSARKSSANFGSTDHKILENAGLRLMFDRANPFVSDRVNSVNALICNANNIRRLYVHTRCVNLVKALIGQVYNKNGKPDDSAGYDHINDALGYLVYQVFPINNKSIIQTF